MAKRLNMVNVFAIIVVVAALVLLQTSEAQTTHVVGDALGWQVSNDGATTYSTWASTQNFTVGDALNFNFIAGAHTVVELSKAGFDACNTSIAPIISSSSVAVNISLTSAGEHYYICDIPTHCTNGQKLAITVSAATPSSPSPPTSATPPSPTTTTPSSPSPSGSTAPPPPNSASPSFATAALPVTLLSIVVALLQ